MGSVEGSVEGQLRKIAPKGEPSDPTLIVHNKSYPLLFRSFEASPSFATDNVLPTALNSASNFVF